MAKVPEQGADVLWQGDWLIVRAVPRSNGTYPAKEWLDGLERKGQGQFLAALRVVENSLRLSRPPAGRFSKLKESTMGLFELRVTLPGSTPPHLRAVFMREGRTLWITHGFTKKTNEFPAGELAEAERILAQWMEKE